VPSTRTLLVVVAVLALPTAAYAHARASRLRVERAAGAVASALTHRSIAVHCPGPVKRHLFYEIHEGEVRFDADGVPENATTLSARICDGLRDVLDHGATTSFDCLTWVCDGDTERAAEALAVLTHEIMHLRGTMDEGRTECLARGRVADVAQRLGVSAPAAQRVARWQATDWQERLPDRYRNATC